MTDSTEPKASPDDAKQENERTVVPAALKLAPGHILLDRFVVENLLGEGAMASVYKCKDRETERIVAIKKVSSNDPNLAKRFAREVNLHRKLQHENIVEAIDCLTDDCGETYFVMEFLDGMSLQLYLSHENTVAREEDLRDIIVQICNALQHAHDEGVLHRDLKPGNIFLHQGPDGMEVKVLDFGIAKPLGNSVSALTQAGVAVGSPMYMSPEQCQGQRVDTRSDVYSLGILCYEMITGSVPYKGQNIMTVLAMHCDPKRKPKPLTDFREDLKLGNHLNNIVMRSLETNSNLRFSTIAEFRTAIELWYTAISLDPDEQHEVLNRLRSLYAVPVETSVSQSEAWEPVEAAVPESHSQPTKPETKISDDELAAYKQRRIAQKSQLRSSLNVEEIEPKSGRPNLLLILVGAVLFFVISGLVWIVIFK